MKIRISKKSIWLFLIVLVALLDWSFYFFPISINDEYDKTLIAIVAILSYMITLTHTWVVKKYKELVKWLMLLVAAVIIQLFLSLNKYPLQSSGDIRVASLYFMIPLLSLTIIYLFEINSGYEKLFEILTKMALVWIIFCFVQAIAYNATGILFIKGNSGNIRFGFIRIKLCNINTLMVIYSLYKIIISKTKTKILYYLVGVLGVLEIILVQQTRTIMLAIIATILVMYIASKKSIKKRYILAFVVLIAGGVLYRLGFFDSFIGSFSLNGDESFSTFNRLNEYDYYLRMFQNNIVTGFGFIPPFRNNAYYSIRAGKSGVYFLDDVGIVGLLAQFGLMSVFVVIGLFIREFISVVNAVRKRKSQDAVFLVGLMTYAVFSMFSVSIFDQQRILLWAFMISIIEFKLANTEKSKNT